MTTPDPLLSTTERELLQELASTATEKLRKRAALLLLYDSGQPTRVVAQQIGLSARQVRHWKREFSLKSMAIFLGSRVEKEPRITVNANSSQPGEPPGIPLPGLRESPGLLPDDPMAVAGKKTLSFHFSQMLAHEPGTRLGEDIEELHDMRVATRRLRAAFRVFSEAYHKKAIVDILKGLRKTGRNLGQVRDQDVFIEKALGYQKSIPVEKRPGLEPLIQNWQQERTEFRSTLLAHLDSQDYASFKDLFNVFVQSPSLGVDRSGVNGMSSQLVRFTVPRLIYTRLASVMAFDARIPSASIPELHALRIEFKYLRYTLEFFREVLGPQAQSVITEIKSMQDHLGELNDAQVACQRLSNFQKDFETHQAALPLLQRGDPSAILEYTAERAAERHRLMLAFPDLWEHFKRPELRQDLALALMTL